MYVNNRWNAQARICKQTYSSPTQRQPGCSAHAPGTLLRSSRLQDSNHQEDISLFRQICASVFWHLDNGNLSTTLKVCFLSHPKKKQWVARFRISCQALQTTGALHLRGCSALSFSSGYFLQQTRTSDTQLPGADGAVSSGMSVKSGEVGGEEIWPVVSETPQIRKK